MSEKRYMLEIYYPGTHEGVCAYFESDTPFQAIGRGDVINPFGFYDVDQTKGLRVISVVHILWNAPKENGIAKHKVCVYTEQGEHSDI